MTLLAQFQRLFHDGREVLFGQRLVGGAEDQREGAALETFAQLLAAEYVKQADVFQQIFLIFRLTMTTSLLRAL